jgi:hypothetical protein
VNDWLAGDAGASLTLTDQQAYEAVEQHHLAVYADDGPQAAPALQYAEPVITIEPQLDPEFREQVAEFMDQNDELLAKLADGKPEPLKMPWSNASKAAWIDWAVHQGAEPEQAAALTKNEHMSKYGERL